MDCKLVGGRGRPKTDGKADAMCKSHQHGDMQKFTSICSKARTRHRRAHDDTFRDNQFSDIPPFLASSPRKAARGAK